jgi:hypothetical protein
MDAVGRWTGGCWIAAGVLVLAELAHPDALSIGFAASSLETLWPAVHVAWTLTTILTLFGLAGLLAWSGAALGRLGVVGAVLAVPGLVVAAGLFLTEAFVFPVLAEEDPALLDLDGVFLGSPAVRLTAGVAGLWFVGLVLVGLAVERAAVLSRGTGMLLAVATALFAAFEGPFLPVVGDVSVVVFSSAQIWLGWALVRQAGQTEGTALPSSPPARRSGSRSRRSAEMR